MEVSKTGNGPRQAAPSKGTRRPANYQALRKRGQSGLSKDATKKMPLAAQNTKFNSSERSASRAKNPSKSNDALKTSESQFGSSSLHSKAGKVKEEGSRVPLAASQASFTSADNSAARAKNPSETNEALRSGPSASSSDSMSFSSEARSAASSQPDEGQSQAPASGRTPQFSQRPGLRFGSQG